MKPKTTKYGLETTNYGHQITNCCAQTTSYGVQTANSHAQTPISQPHYNRWGPAAGGEALRIRRTPKGSRA